MWESLSWCLSFYGFTCASTSLSPLFCNVFLKLNYFNFSIYLSSDCRHTLNNDEEFFLDWTIFHTWLYVYRCIMECLQDIFQRVVLLTVKNTNSKKEDTCVHSFALSPIFQTISMINCTRKKECVLFYF